MSSEGDDDGWPPGMGEAGRLIASHIIIHSLALAMTL